MLSFVLRTYSHRAILVAYILPSSLSQETDGQEHFYPSFARGQEVVRLVEDAMSQSGTHQNAHEAIDEQGVKEFVLDLLLLIETSHDQIGQSQSYEPA